MGISRDSRHKRSATGAKRAHYRALTLRIEIDFPSCAGCKLGGILQALT